MKRFAIALATIVSFSLPAQAHYLHRQSFVTHSVYAETSSRITGHPDSNYLISNVTHQWPVSPHYLTRSVTRRRRVNRSLPPIYAKSSTELAEGFAPAYAVGNIVSHVYREIGSARFSGPNTCGPWVNHILREAGYRPNRSGFAYSFANYGRPSGFVPGAVAVVRGWGRRGRHVGIALRKLPDGRTLVASASHGRRVNIKPYYVLAYRLP